MMNLILRFHAGCITSEKDVICGHLANFCHKIGVNFS